MLNTFYPIEAIDIATPFVNSLHALQYLVDGVTAVVTLVFSGLLVVTALPFGAFVAGQVAWFGFLLIGINFAVQFVAAGGIIEDAIISGLFIDSVTLILGLIVSAVIQNDLIAGVFGIGVFLIYVKFFGLPGVLARCGEYCPFNSLLRELINYIG
jgi:hypothetical protein